MEETQKKQSTLGRVLEGIFVVLVLAVLFYFIFGQIALPREIAASYERCEPFEVQWEQVFADGSREPVEIPGECKASPGESFVIEATLGEIEHGSSLSFYSLKQDMKVYVGDELRTTYSTKDTRIFGSCSPRNYIFVDICEADSGKTLRVELVSESVHAGTLKTVYYGDKAAIWRQHIKGNIFSLCITAFVWIISVIAIISCAVVRLRLKKELSILYFGWSMLLLSSWLIAQSDIRQLLFKNISVVGDVAMACSTLFLIPLTMYFNIVFGKRYQSYANRLKEAGVVMLENERIILPAYNMEICGAEIGREYYGKFKTKKMPVSYMEKLLGKVAENTFTLLIAHNPDYFETYASWGADLTVSGHVHGGLMVLPFLGGVISPSLKLLPKYDGGEFRDGKHTMILGRGLGTHTLPIRIFNPGELVVIHLKPVPQKVD